MSIKDLCLNCLAVAIIFKAPGCHPTDSYWLKGPVAEKRVVYKSTMNYYTKFTVVPYSVLTGGVSSREENAVMFGLANVFLQSGYRYVSTVDSADFVIVAEVTNDYIEGQNMDSELVNIPQWKDVPPFTLDPTSFGTEAIQPEPWMSGPLSRIQPKFRAFVYNPATRQCICTYAAGAVLKDNNLLHGCQHFYWSFRDSMIHAQHPLSVGNGEAGFQFNIWSENGVDFWPEIAWCDTNYPASKAGLRRGDAILELNEVDLKNLTFPQVMDLFRGDSGKILDLAIWRFPDHAFPVTFVMDKRAKQLSEHRHK